MDALKQNDKRLNTDANKNLRLYIEGLNFRSRKKIMKIRIEVARRGSKAMLNGKKIYISEKRRAD